MEEGLRELFIEIFGDPDDPNSEGLKDYTGTRFEIKFLGYRFEEKPRCGEDEAKKKGLMYARGLRARFKLIKKETGEVLEQEVFMGEFPIMTERGSFIINGAERCVVSQLMRSPGAYFTLEEDPSSGRELCSGKLIPMRGAWLEFDMTSRDVIYVKVDRRYKIPATILLKASLYPCFEFCGVSEEDVLRKFEDDDPELKCIRSTIDKERDLKEKISDTRTNWEKAIRLMLDKGRPGELNNIENARSYMRSLLFDKRRYDLGKVGRYKLNKRLGVDVSPDTRILTRADLIEFIRHMIRVNRGVEEPDDIDHLGNRRVRPVGELLQNHLRAGFLRLEKNIKDRMSLVDTKDATITSLINNRPITASIKEFFGTSQLSQFMDKTNPLSELTHKRRLSAMGPGGLSRERAGFEVRDVHHSHYGRICPVETPEGPNIGLITSLATYARVNELGFLETPYRKVKREVPSSSEDLIGREIRERIEIDGEVLIDYGEVITREKWEKIKGLGRDIKVKPFVSDEVVYLPADEEEKYIIAQANIKLDEKGQFEEKVVEARKGGRPSLESSERVDFVDVSPKQVFSITASLIPFLEHNDANRALMGSNMQRQAVPLIKPEPPLVKTGVEGVVARNTGYLVIAEEDGEVVSVDGRRIGVRGEKGERVYELRKFERTNQGTCLNHRIKVRKGDKVKKGDILADTYSTENGLLALGKNLLVAFMSWEGYNYEDAIVISERLVRDEELTSIHIEEYEVEARQTKLGPEEITRDIPNVGEESLKNLDESGIVRIGAYVSSNDILVGKITPKGERVQTGEERLLRAIFGEKAKDIRDTSLRMPYGESGRVIDVLEFRKEDGNLSSDVHALVKVYVAQKRQIKEGDKLSGRHGNKGVIAKILPIEDMPYLPDGRPVDIILNPLGIPSRMNIGQLLETHLGWAASVLGFDVISPIFDGAKIDELEEELSRAWLCLRAGAIKNEGGDIRTDMDVVKEFLRSEGFSPDEAFKDAKRTALRIWLKDHGVEDVRDEELEKEVWRVYKEKRVYPPTFGKLTLYDGRTGEPFQQPVVVGYMYIMKLIHLVEDKIHARSTGPYSLITQQPLGGKAHFGGQRFGEMEVWALEAYGAAHTLQEMLTVKSDDVAGRIKTYEMIVKGEDIQEAGIPESFKVLMSELKSLCLDVELLSEEKPYTLKGVEIPRPPEGISLTRPEYEEVEEGE